MNDDSIVLLPQPVLPITTTMSSSYRIPSSSSAFFRFFTSSDRFMVSFATINLFISLSLLLSTPIFYENRA